MPPNYDPAKPLIVFLKPPPGVRLHTPGTPPDGHLDPGRRVVREKGGARLLDYGAGPNGEPRFAAEDPLHWTGFWPAPKEAVEALRRLRAMNAPRIEAYRRQQTRAQVQAGVMAGLNVLAPEVAGAVRAIQAAVKNNGGTK